MTTPSAPPGGEYRLDQDMLDAAVALVGRTGATNFELDCVDHSAPIAKAGWYASAYYKGIRIFEENHPGPAEAADALATRLLHGAMCQGCGKFIAAHDGDVPMPGTLFDGTQVDPKEAVRRGLCRWERVGKTWTRGCGPDVPEDSTREKLARAMAEAGCPTTPIRHAREGYYDEYLSTLAFPLMTLVDDLNKNGYHQLAERVKEGEFDATKAESDAWAASDEGRAVFAEFFGSARADSRAAADAPGPGSGPGGSTRSDGRPAWRSKRGKTKKKR